MTIKLAETTAYYIEPTHETFVVFCSCLARQTRTVFFAQPISDSLMTRSRSREYTNNNSSSSSSSDYYYYYS